MISVIVPLYKGKKYIKNMVKQIEDASKMVDSMVELLFINDFPDEEIEELNSEWISIVVVNTNINLGIQGARIKGLNLAKGEYVLFLDQDDIIFPHYFSSQLNRIEDKDAVVCRLKHGENLGYSNKKQLKDKLNLNFLINEGNAIYSPGQVIIRKEAIPDFWRNNVLKVNGADDWLLWICMAKKGSSFSVNDEILFEHTLHDNNLSSSEFNMSKSEREMSDLLKKNEILSDIEQDSLEKCIQKKMDNRLKEYDKFRKKFVLYEKWLNLNLKSKRISDYLIEKNIKTVCIYGAAEVGKQIYNELTSDGIKVVGFIDNKSDLIIREIPVYNLNDFSEKCQMVIISLTGTQEVLKQQIKDKLKADVCTIEEVINSLLIN